MKHHLHVVQDGQPDTDESWTMRQFQMTVRSVCEPCNNGWMSKLEGRLKPFFEGALQGQGMLLEQPIRRDLAAWALKTAMMAESQQRPGQPAVLPEEYPYLFAQGEPSTRVRVWIGAYTGAVSTAYGHLWGLDFAAPQDPDPAHQSGVVWGATIVFGPVVFQLLGSNIQDLLTGAEMNTPGVHELWPCRQSFTWQPKPGLRDADLPGFTSWFLDGLLALSGEETPRARQLP